MSSMSLLRFSLADAVAAIRRPRVPQLWRVAPSPVRTLRNQRTLTSSATASSATRQPSAPSERSAHNNGSGSESQDSGSSSNSSPQNAATLLLLDSVPYIAQYGFIPQAYLRSSPTTSPTSSSFDAEELNKRLRILSTLFPGPDSSFSTALFNAWNNISDLSIIHSLTPSQVIDSLRSGNPLSDSLQKSVRMQPSLSKEQERDSLSKVSDLIEARLRLSWEVKAHLKHGLTALSTASPTTSTLHSIFPHETVLPNLPNPAPLLELSSAFVTQALTHPSAQQRTSWIDPDGPEWYAVRTRLTAAYTAATLHMASDSIVNLQDSQALFRRIVQGRESGLVATFEALAGSAKKWVRWGGRGWLGTLRSLGL